MEFDEERRELLVQIGHEEGLKPDFVKKIQELVDEFEPKWSVHGSKAAFKRKLEAMIEDEANRQHSKGAS